MMLKLSRTTDFRARKWKTSLWTSAEKQLSQLHKAKTCQSGSFFSVLAMISCNLDELHGAGRGNAEKKQRGQLPRDFLR